MYSLFFQEVRLVFAAAWLRVNKRLISSWRARVSDARLELRSNELNKIRPKDADEKAVLDCAWFDILIDTCERRSRVMENLLAEARRLGAETPDLDDPLYVEKLDYGVYFEGKAFTDAGLRRAFELLRPARKERSDAIARWVTLAIGLIGALTGLVVALR